MYIYFVFEKCEFFEFSSIHCVSVFAFFSAIDCHHLLNIDDAK